MSLDHDHEHQHAPALDATELHRHPHQHAPTPAGAAPLIEVDHLHFVYPDGMEALRGIDLTVSSGEKLALVGPNGAGKSTLMLQLNGILQPTHGEVRVAGVPVDRRSLRAVRAQVGLVFQDPDDQLFSPTVYEDVAFGPLHMGLPAADIHARVESAVAAVGMTGSERRMPHRLSLGQRKRVAIATVLSMRPEVLVLDEPTAGLDPRGRRELIRLLSGMQQTLIVSTHDMRLVAEIFPRTVLMDEGRIVADGPTDAILSDDELLEAHGLERP